MSKCEDPNVINAISLNSYDARARLNRTFHLRSTTVDWEQEEREQKTLHRDRLRARAKSVMMDNERQCF